MSRIAAFALLLAAPAAAQDQTAAVAAQLAAAAPGTRFGLVVADDTGREIVALRPDERFIPASNTKIYTVAALFWAMQGLDRPDASGGAAVRIEADGSVVLVGHGDARLSSAPDCREDCLATLADAVAARTKRVRDVVGDDSLFPDERWSPGMSWNNIPTRSGTGISALTLDDNELPLTVRPGPAIGAVPLVETPGYDAVDDRATTVAAGRTQLAAERMPGTRTIRLTGTIALGAAPEAMRLGIDDPADWAAWRLRQLLEARGVRVTGSVTTRHRPLSDADDPARRGAVPAARPSEPEPLARLVPPPLEADLAHTMKVSQNLHAELALRRLGLLYGSGSIADGQAQVRAMLAEADVPRSADDFADGSGMSTYNRIRPRATVALLHWIAAQPWGARWRATLATSGEGTLARRFGATPLAGHLWAKTGSLNATTALSGYLVAASGRTLTFSFLANDIPDGASAIPAMDAALVAIAAAN